MITSGMTPALSDLLSANILDPLQQGKRTSTQGEIMIRRRSVTLTAAALAVMSLTLSTAPAASAVGPQNEQPAASATGFRAEGDDQGKDRGKARQASVPLACRLFPSWCARS